MYFFHLFICLFLHVCVVFRFLLEVARLSESLGRLFYFISFFFRKIKCDFVRFPKEEILYIYRERFPLDGHMVFAI